MNTLACQEMQSFNRSLSALTHLARLQQVNDTGRRLAGYLRTAVANGHPIDQVERDAEMLFKKVRLELEFNVSIKTGESTEEDPLEDQIVIKYPEIQIEFDYPMANPMTKTFASPGGFTRKELARVICDTYHQIYAEEDQAVGHPGRHGSLINRAQSHGPHGIWGHDIGDLYLERVYQEQGNRFSLFIGS